MNPVDELAIKVGQGPRHKSNVELQNACAMQMLAGYTHLHMHTTPAQ